MAVPVANLPRNNTMNESVKERRIRPLYDLLDTGNSKKVLQEADKILKKHPNFSCAKVFKSLAYIRLGKMEECMSIMNQVFDEVPTDESTLHAMSICYRELDMPEKVCILYENACRSDRCEEHMTSWFMAYVRVLDFPNQHKVAMQLYKTYSKGTYLLWAVMSLYVKAVVLDDQKIATAITLPLAARMMAKYLDENPGYSYCDVYLYIRVLFRMADYSGAISVLEKAKDKVQGWSYDQHARLEMACLTKMKDAEKLMAACEKDILHDTTNFKNYKQYVEMFGLEKPDHVIHFLRRIAYDGQMKVTSRCGLLGLILIAQNLMEKKISSNTVDIRQLFIDYFTNFGSKPFFIRDMKHHFKYLKDNHEVTITSTIQEDLVNHHFKYLKDNNEITVASMTEGDLKNCKVSKEMLTILQWKSNFECTQYFLREPKILSDPSIVIKCVSKMVKTYTSADEHLKSSGLKSDARDISPYEDVLITSCMVLMKTVWNKSEFWSGYYLASHMSSIDLGNNDSVVKSERPIENGLLPGLGKPDWFEGEFPIVLSLVLLEYGILSSPHCYQFRVMLGKTYLFCGAEVAGLYQIMKMDIKHMQIDSLGYLYLPKTLMSGVLTDIQRVMVHADGFYGNCSKELLEHVISAYKNTSWNQILEFMEFRETVANSVQGCQIRVEKRLLDYTTEGNSREQLYKIAQREHVGVEAAFTTRFEDNRDFNIHNFMFEDDSLEEYRQLTFKDSIEKLKLRASILGTITNFIRALSNLKDPKGCIGYIAKSRQAFDAFCKIIKSPPKEYVQDSGLEYRCLFGPWPPSAHEYLESRMIVDSLHDFLALVLVAGTFSQQGNSQEDINTMCTAMKDAGETLSENINVYLTYWSEIHISLINMANLNEDIFLVVETLGFLCILTDVLKGFFEKIVPLASETKAKKKKSKDNLIRAPWVTQYNSLAKVLLSCLSLIEERLSDLEIQSGGWYSRTWSESQENFWAGKVPEVLLLVVKRTLPTVCGRLSSSFAQAYTEMKSNISSKKQFVENLVIN